MSNFLLKHVYIFIFTSSFLPGLLYNRDLQGNALSNCFCFLNLFIHNSICMCRNCYFTPIHLNTFLINFLIKLFVQRVKRMFFYKHYLEPNYDTYRRLKKLYKNTFEQCIVSRQYTRHTLLSHIRSSRCKDQHLLGFRRNNDPLLSPLLYLTELDRLLSLF